MDRHVLWTPWEQPGLEHVHVHDRDDGVFADGVIVAIGDEAPFRVAYTIRCDAQWRLREVHVVLSGGVGGTIQLRTDGEGAWSDTTGQVLPMLEGIRYVDISVTPLTNTLPIRRLDLQPGEGHAVAMLYVELPAMRLSAVDQRYTCLERTAEGGIYRYDDLKSGFTADLPVDADGLVIDYPGLFRRVWSA